MVRTPLAAADSLAAIRARSRFGIAMAAMIRMIATTISNSISEKPFCLRMFKMSPRLRFELFWFDDQPPLQWHDKGHELQARKFDPYFRQVPMLPSRIELRLPRPTGPGLGR